MASISSPIFPNYLESDEGSFALKTFSVDQASELWSLIVSDRHFPERKNLWPGIASRDQLQTYLKTCDVSNSKSEEIGYCLFWKNQMVGSFHLHSMSWINQRIELGYWIHYEFEGQGLISKALQVMEKQLAKMNFHRIEIRCDPLNRKSCLVAENNKYTMEGTLREYECVNGVYKDKAIYSKLLKS